MERKELISSQEYVLSKFQLGLLNLIEEYMKKNNLNRTQLAEKLGVGKSYVSQLMNVAFDHKISKVVELALACNAMPLLYFVDLDNYIKSDSEDKAYELFPIARPRNISFEIPQSIAGRPVDYPMPSGDTNTVNAFTWKMTM